MGWFPFLRRKEKRRRPVLFAERMLRVRGKAGRRRRGERFGVAVGMSVARAKGDKGLTGRTDALAL